MKVGEKRRYAIQLNSDVPLSLALLALRFDPKVVKVHGVTAGTILPTIGETAALFTPMVDGSAGTCIVSISSLNGKASFKGSGPLLFIDVEAIAEGNASLMFVKQTLVATDGRDVKVGGHSGNGHSEAVAGFAIKRHKKRKAQAIPFVLFVLFCESPNGEANAAAKRLLINGTGDHDHRADHHDAGRDAAR